MAEYYNIFKALHVIAVISWMAGMLYLPRLFVYHCGAEKGGEADKTFKIMETKLIKIIINPAMMLTLLFGLINTSIYGLQNLGVWFHIKMTAVFFLMLLHGLLIKWHKKFLKDENVHSHMFFRVINEVVTFFMVISVIMVIVKPFE
jgi:putative membrane protein